MSKKRTLLLFSIIICLLIAGISGGCGSAVQTNQNTGAEQETDNLVSDSNSSESTSVGETSSKSASTDSAGSASEEDSEYNTGFEVHILDVGQGLSVLIKSDGYYMLYDGGGGDSSSYVVAYLRECSIDMLTYLVASHYDADHISGLVGVLNTTAVETALTPDYVADSNIYQSFRSMLESNGAPEVHPAAGDTFMLGSAEIQIISPASYTYEDENDNSVAMRIVYGNFSCILTGDAGEEAEADMMASGYTLGSDLYVVGHHGSAWSSSEAFVAAVSPAYAVISAGAGNSYGHPAEKTLSVLKEAGAALYRTDLQGEIICYTDGTDCWFNVAGSDNWMPGEELSLEETDEEASSLAETDGDDSASMETSGAEYSSGETESSMGTTGDSAEKAAGEQSDRSESGESSTEQKYVLNTRTMKFHYPDCPSVSQMSEKNKETVMANRETLIQEGYSSCGNCCP